MDDYKPIACGSYDYLEIACMDRYDVEVHLASVVLTGIADGLLTRDSQEFLLLKTPDTEATEIRVDKIRVLRVITRPARFNEVQFAESSSALPR